MKWKDLKHQALELILGATAFLIVLIARYDMGLSTATIRTGALYAVGASSPRSPAARSSGESNRRDVRRIARILGCQHSSTWGRPRPREVGTACLKGHHAAPSRRTDQ
jgi:hypothetical protein